MIFEKTIADNYTAYVDDERGYQFHAWDVTPLAEIRSHDRILHCDLETLTNLDSTGINNLERWALAKAFRTHQHIDEFFKQCEQLITSDAEHPALNYAEILESYLEELARADRLDQAKRILESTHLTNLPLDLEGRILLLAGNETSANDIFHKRVAEHPDDAELRFDIAENFFKCGYYPTSLEWLDDAQEVAIRINDSAILVDIELLRLDIDENAGIIAE